jgi:lipid-A-disaccharide synthase
VDTWFDVSDLEAVGVVEAAGRLPMLRRVKSRILREVKAGRFNTALLIDYPGFNLHLAGSLHARGVKVIQFVAPQLWAWGRWRARWMAHSVDKLLVILPFEVEFFRGLGVEAVFVGNPLVDMLENESRGREPVLGAREKFGIRRDEGGPVIGLLPGSRTSEIASLLPAILEAAEILRPAYPDAQFLLPVAENLPWDKIAARAEESGVRPVQGARDVLRVSEAALVASGTATLEAGLLGTPGVIAYRLHPMTAPLARLMWNLPPERYYIGLVNILAGEALFPELLQDHMTSDNLAIELRRILEDKNRISYVKQRLAEVQRSLGGPGCFDRAAEVILEAAQA